MLLEKSELVLRPDCSKLFERFSPERIEVGLLVLRRRYELGVESEIGTCKFREGSVPVLNAQNGIIETGIEIEAKA